MNSFAPSRVVSLLTKVLVPVAACAVVATLMPTTPTVTASPQLTPAGSSAVNLRFGSFNVMTVSGDKTHGNQRPWKVRRGTVIREILGESVDVIGVQEANQSSHFASHLVDGQNQYLDLRNGLNKAGGNFALANANAYNCVRPDTAWKCHYKNRGASNSERILYNPSHVTRIYAGAMQYRHQSSDFKGASLAWAWMRAKGNGHKFLFTTTHLNPTHRGVRQAQWWEMIRKIKQIRHGYPVVSVGDFNAQKFDSLTKPMLPAMKNAGIGDILNQRYRVNPPSGVRAKHLINAWINTNNHWLRNMRTWAYEDQHNKIGNNIDYIFASNYLKVPEYKLVVSHSGLNVDGVFPSDHNMIRATITIP
jgi:endonuclease/exonuclease/phosphatase family metal-dependent hydrolase